jgi:hypothetical protein
MFGSDDNFQPDAAEFDQSLEHEDFETPALWALDDFSDILHACQALQEALP